MIAKSSLLDFAINVMNFWLPKRDNTGPVIARTKGPTIHGPLVPPTPMCIPWVLGRVCTQTTNGSQRSRESGRNVVHPW